MEIITWNMSCRLWQPQEQQPHLSDCRRCKHWGRWMALAGQPPFCGSCLLRGISDIERMACVCSSLLSREQVSSLPLTLSQTSPVSPNAFSFQSLNHTRVGCALIFHLPCCQGVFWGTFERDGFFVCSQPGWLTLERGVLTWGCKHKAVQCLYLRWDGSLSTSITTAGTTTMTLRYCSWASHGRTRWAMSSSQSACPPFHTKSTVVTSAG